ncbi:MAG: hypothetical protein RIM99_13830 [Cyclobacteriaceae bacterium]
MKNSPLLLLAVVFLATFVRCSNNTEIPGIDCSLSDLTFTVTEKISPDCVTQGSIELSGSGGTAPYVFSLNGANFQTSNVFEDLSAALYSITIKDANECTFTGSTTLDAAGGAIELSVLAIDSDCLSATGTITASAIGGDGNYMYTLDGGTPQASGSFSNVSSGSHTISVSDASGCTASVDEIVNSGTSWANDIMPIINANCAVSGCHNGDNGQSRNWTVFSNVQTNAENIKTRTGNKSMPQVGSGITLTDNQIALIACWVDDGAQNN